MQGYWQLGVAVAALFIHLTAAEAGPVLDAGHRAMRTIDDASTGERWALERVPDHPGGPGRMVKIASVAVPRDGKPVPVIRVGDSVLVEEKTNVATLRLQGVALTSANRGSRVMVRLKVGGWLVRAVAEERGKARLGGEVY